MGEYSHSFPALRGLQAGRVFYVAMCPLRIIPKIFVFNEDEVPAELRAQRVLNRARVPELAAYLADNPNSYILSALTASVDAKVEFTPFGDSGSQNNLGMVKVPMDAQILINDGQHRRAAIEEALKGNKALGQDNVPVLLFVDAGLKRSQQMFADLNKYAVRPSSSLGTLYDHRDHCSELARYLATSCSTFKGVTEFEKSAISNRSVNLFTLSSIKNASRALLRKGPKDQISDTEKETAREFWESVAIDIPDWKKARDRTVSTADLREIYIHSHAIALHALGLVGACLLEQRPSNWKTPLKRLKSIDWSRKNTRVWDGRAIVNGRISKATTNVILTASFIKKTLGLRQSPEELQLESEYMK